MGRRTALLIGALGLLVWAATSDSVHSAVSDAVGWGSELVSGYPYWGPVVFVLISGASAMLAFFSSVPLVPVAVEAWGEGQTFLLLWVAWMLGGVVTYGLGRSLGPRIASWFVEPATLRSYQQTLRTRAGFPTILIFQLALPSEIPGYVLGTLRYPFLVYVPALALAELPYALSSVFLSESFLQREYTILIAVGVGAIALSGLALRGLRRRFGDDRG